MCQCLSIFQLFLQCIYKKDSSLTASNCKFSSARFSLHRGLSRAPKALHLRCLNQDISPGMSSKTRLIFTFRAPQSSTVSASSTTVILKLGVCRSSLNKRPFSNTLLPVERRKCLLTWPLVVFSMLLPIKYLQIFSAHQLCSRRTFQLPLHWQCWPPLGRSHQCPFSPE